MDQADTMRQAAEMLVDTIFSTSPLAMKIMTKVEMVDAIRSIITECTLNINQESYYGAVGSTDIKGRYTFALNLAKTDKAGVPAYTQKATVSALSPEAPTTKVVHIKSGQVPPADLCRQTGFLD